MLTRRSNINLVIGVVTTLLAVGLLAYVVLPDTLSSSDVGMVLLHFLPRLSIVVFIQTFSFFFLRLYRSGLNDIKYYQNELTNLETKHLVLESLVGGVILDQAKDLRSLQKPTGIVVWPKRLRLGQRQPRVSGMSRASLAKSLTLRASFHHKAR